MNLFFETSRQSSIFLLCVPIGFLTAMGIDIGRGRPLARFLMDIVVLQAGALAFLILQMIADENALRLYHLLGALCGALLYMLGFFRLRHGICRMLKGKLRSKSFRQAGKVQDGNEKYEE